MVARVSFYENVDLDLAERVQRWMEGLDADPFGGLPGYRGSMTLVDRDNARLVGIGFYDGPGEAREAEALLAAMRERERDRVPEPIRPALGKRPASVGIFDVAHRD